MAESRNLDVDEDEELSQNELEIFDKLKQQYLVSKRLNNKDNQFAEGESEPERYNDNKGEEQEDLQRVEQEDQHRKYEEGEEEEDERDYQDEDGGDGEAHYHSRSLFQDAIFEFNSKYQHQIDDAPACIKEIRCYAESANACERQISCRHLMETLKLVSESPDDVKKLFEIIRRLSEEKEPCVVAELIEHVLPIARYCYDKEHLHYLIADQLAPLLLNFVMVSNHQVRNNSQECLRILLLENLIDQDFVKRDICPMISDITYSTRNSDKYSNAIMLMTKMAPVLGRELTEEFFVPTIISLSMDSVVGVRKICISHFGEFCSAVSTQVTENILLPYFVRSCYDKQWDVRRSCAEVIMSVSCACCLETRKSTLAPVCAALLSDDNRSVRMAAFKTLGPFITTFAEPSITGLAYNQHGQLVLTNWSGFEFRSKDDEFDRFQKFEEENNADMNDYVLDFMHSSLRVGVINTNDRGNNNSNIDEDDAENSNSNLSSVLENCKLRDYDQNSTENSIIVNTNNNFQLTNGNVSNQYYDSNSNNNVFNNFSGNNIMYNYETIHIKNASEDENEDNLQQYNAFLYWRDPLPVIDDLEIPVSIANWSQSFDDSFNSSSSSSVSDEDDNISKNSSFINSDNDQLNCDIEQNGVINSSSYVPSTSNSSTPSSPDNSCNESSTPNKRKIPIVSKGNGSNKDHHSSIMMYDRLYSEFSNDLTYKSIPVLPFPDSSIARQNVGLFKVSGLGLCQKKPCEKPRQNIVPQELIDHFVSLSDPVLGNSEDCRFLVYQIAYSFPAVAQTLGKENWPLLKNMYERLAEDKKWKVRRAVASSIHELAVIIGQDAATLDLVPIFNNIIKDLDVVRIGALKHLAMFLKILKPAEKNSFLPKLAEFLMTDCNMNWRFREELAEQLMQMVGMFSAADTYTHLMPLAILLLLDKVAAVRQVALSLVTELVRWISSDVRLLHSILVELAEQFARSTRWNRRQTFALLCSKLVSHNVLPDETFAINALPHLLDLSWDSVPNVRLAVARTLSTDIANHSYFSDPINPNHEVIMQTLRRLQADKDRDVQYFAFSKPWSESPSSSDDGNAQDQEST